MKKFNGEELDEETFEAGFNELLVDTLKELSVAQPSGVARDETIEIRPGNGVHMKMHITVKMEVIKTGFPALDDKEPARSTH